MMMNNDDEPKDWEIEDENPPEHLQRKWEKDETREEPVLCPSCRKMTPRHQLTCLFCGARVFHDSGLLGNFLKWIKRLTS